MLKILKNRNLRGFGFYADIHSLPMWQIVTSPPDIMDGCLPVPVFPS